MEEYNFFLKEIQKELGNGITDNDTLMKAGKELFGNDFLGVFPSDKEPKKMYDNQCCIINVDKSGQIGSHWMSIFYKNGKRYLYDSFGRNFNKLIKNRNIGGQMTENDAEQKEVEENCGQRSLAWLCTIREFGIKKGMSI